MLTHQCQGIKLKSRVLTAINKRCIQSETSSLLIGSNVENESLNKIMS